jgi:hypothetical protein
MQATPPILAYSSDAAPRLGPLRIAYCVTLVLFGAWLLGGFRTMTVGTSFRLTAAELVVASAFAPGFWAGYLFVGVPWRRALRHFAFVVLCAVALCEAAAVVQEWWVMLQYGNNPAGPVSVQRWFASGNTIEYQPGYGWFGQD